MKKLTGRQNTEPFNILAQFTQMNQAEFKLLSMVLLFAHAQNTTPILILTFKIFERQDLMSKFSHSSSRVFVWYLEQQLCTCSALCRTTTWNDQYCKRKRISQFFLKPAYFSSECNSRRVAYISKSERDRINVLKFLKNVKPLFKFRHRVILNSLLC